MEGGTYSALRKTKGYHICICKSIHIHHLRSMVIEKAYPVTKQSIIVHDCDFLSQGHYCIISFILLDYLLSFYFCRCGVRKNGSLPFLRLGVFYFTFFF